MESKLWQQVDGQSFIQWIVIFALVGFFILKEWPGLWDRITKQVKREQLPESLASRLDRIEADVAEIKDKLSRDYGRINTIEERQDIDRKAIKEIKTEQGIIMRALLGTLKGLQQLGANGETESASEEIMDYLNRQAHKED